MKVHSRKNLLIIMPDLIPAGEVDLSAVSFSQVIDDHTLKEMRTLSKVTIVMNVEGLSEDKFSKIVRQSEAEILLTGWGSPKVTMRVYKENPQLRYMCHAAGTVRPYVDKEVIEAGLIVTNGANAIARSVAECALTMILTSLRQITSLSLEMHLRKGWQTRPLKIEGLFQQRVGFHGFGVIARELTKLLRPFSCDMSAFSPHVPDEILGQYDVRRVRTLEEVFEINRIVSVHAANTPANQQVINEKVLRKLEDGGLIVNTARGQIIDENALVKELTTGRINAALDVFDEEPLPENSPIRNLDNCLLTPHVGGPTPDRMKDMGEMALTNIRRYVLDESLEHVITPMMYDLIT